ncbi:MAG: hypothetical protein IJB35_03830, partial [Oscillospiraceae bacterium]|nr:hypothetical protein [Oscillospiraceae bacterium]
FLLFVLTAISLISPVHRLRGTGTENPEMCGLDNVVLRARLDIIAWQFPLCKYFFYFFGTFFP